MCLPLLRARVGNSCKASHRQVKSGIVERARFSGDGSVLAVVYGARQDPHPTATSFTRGSQVKLWDVKTGRELHSLAPGACPMDVEFASDNRQIGTIGTTGQISLWDVQSGSKLRDLTSSPMAKITAPVFTPGQRPTIANMPNMADISAMMTNMLGGLAAGTMGRTSLAFSTTGACSQSAVSNRRPTSTSAR